jgi:hypothetical protein
MRIVWDEPKRQTNIARHGLDLADAELFDWEGAIVVSGHSGAGGRHDFGDRPIEERPGDGRVFSARHRGNLRDQLAPSESDGKEAV